MLYGPGPWNPGDQLPGGQWTVSLDSGGTAAGDGSGLDLATSSGRELITAGESLNDFDMTVTATLNAPGDGVDSIEVLWHVTGPDTYFELTIGTAGWQIQRVDSGVVSPLGPPLNPAAVILGIPVTIHVVSAGAVTGVTVDSTVIAFVSDGSSGDIGLASSGADATFSNVALST